MQQATTKGLKYDAGKTKWRLLPWSALETVVKVLMFGAAKYEENSWQGVEKERYVDAAMRHLVAYIRGERLDEESGLPHLAHLACCVLFILWKDQNETAVVPTAVPVDNPAKSNDYLLHSASFGAPRSSRIVEHF